MMKGLLTYTSKMPGPSFSLPAMKSCPWAVTADHADGRKAICAGCYALDGSYRFNSVKAAQQRRFDWVRELIKTDEGIDEAAQTLVDAIRKTKAKHFRIHDSGDFFSVRYVEVWIKVAHALPAVKFWAPTRSYQDKALLEALKCLAAMPNVVVRPSALHFEGEIPRVDGLQAGSTADGPADHTCPATKEEGCGDCRSCWDKSSGSVNYPVHGQQGTKLVRIGKQGRIRR